MTLPYGFVDSLGMFFIYAFIGWIIEVIYYGLTEGRFINRGFLNGPLCPVYGVGFYAVILVLLRIQDNFPLLFFGSMLITTTIEFLAGLILYKLFNLRWWDYSNYKFNLKGFICVQFSIYWGIACTLGMKVLHPMVLFILGKVPFVAKAVVLGILSSLLIADLITTVITIIGLKKKLVILSNVSKEIRNVSDKIGGTIYGGVETVVNKTAPAVESYNSYMKIYNANRSEEKALFKKHRQEEMEFLKQLVSDEKLDFKISRKDINEKFIQLSRGLKRSERSLVHKLASGKNDAYRMIINVLKKDEEENK